MLRTLTVSLLGALALAAAPVALAQSEHYVDRPLEINVHAGGLALDDADTEVIFGVRGAWHTRSGFGFGGNFDVVPVGNESRLLAFEGEIFLTSGEVSYTFPSDDPTHFFVAAGIGAATFSPDDGDSESELLIPVGGGFKWFLADSRYAIRAEVRDQIIRVDNGDSETLHNWEFSVGISFLFGP